MPPRGPPPTPGAGAKPGWLCSTERAEARALGHYVGVSWVGAVEGAAGGDLVEPLIALDGLSSVVQSRVLDAT